MVEIALLGFACGFVSYTIARGSIFDPLRDFFFFRTQWMVLGRVFKFFHGLLSCPYCVSHWVAFLMVYTWRPTLTSCDYPLADVAVSAFIIVGVSSLSWGLFEKLIGTD